MQIRPPPQAEKCRRTSTERFASCAVEGEIVAGVYGPSPRNLVTCAVLPQVALCVLRHPSSHPLSKSLSISASAHCFPPPRTVKQSWYRQGDPPVTDLPGGRLERWHSFGFCCFVSPVVAACALPPPTCATGQELRGLARGRGRPPRVRGCYGEAGRGHRHHGLLGWIPACCLHLPQQASGRAGPHLSPLPRPPRHLGWAPALLHWL